jgi:hypothetical protein
MGLLEKLDRLDDRAFGHLPGAQRRRQADNPAQVMADLACRASGFLRDHAVVFGVLISLDLFNIVTNVVSLITANTASQSVFRVGELVGGVSGVAMLLFLRQGRPRLSIDAAAVAITVQVLAGILLSILKSRPSLAGLAAFSSIFAVGGVCGRHLVPHRCSDVNP